MNYHDLSTNTLVMDAAPVAAPSSFIGVYKRDDGDRDIDYIEKSFTQLEGEADKIIEKIDGTISKGKVPLKRGEVNTLREFLFLISYRNGHRSQQFVEERFDDATIQRIKAFQAEHGLRDIRSVWFFNLRNILDSKHWGVRGNPKVFFADRLDYIVEQDWFHLRFFLTPSGSEFIFTGAMGVSEGSPIQDPILQLTLDTIYGESRHWTGTQDGAEGVLSLSRCWAFTPRLLVVLSNDIIAQNQLSPNENSTEMPYDIQQSYFHDLPKALYEITCNPPLSPAASHMFNAPVATFTQEHHRLRREFEEMSRLDGQIIDARIKDVLTFQVGKLTEDQSARVNVLLLEHCDTNIVFITAKSLRRALRRYAREGRMGTRGDGGVSFQILEEKLAVEEKRDNKQ